MSDLAQSWEPGVFSAACDSGKYPALAYVRRNFALDFRATDDLNLDGLPVCWMLSHIPSGRGILGIRNDIEAAKKLADRFEALAPDWSSDDMATYDQFLPGAREIYDSLGDAAVVPSLTFGQWAFEVLK